jgi:uncharacterized membrane protein YqjE
MNFINTIANNACLWKWYFIIATIISLVVGMAKFREQYVKRDLDSRGKFSHTLHFSIYHGLSVAFGFLLIFCLIQLLSFLVTKASVWNVAIVGVLFIIILVSSIFCISGRGIEVLHRIVMDPGVKKIHVGLKGITLELRDKNK